MSEEYEIIFITEEGRAIKNNKTGKIYHSEFEIIDEKNKEIDRLNNIINKLEKWCNECIDNHIIARENGYTTISDTFFEIVLDKIKALKKEGNK